MSPIWGDAAGARSASWKGVIGRRPAGALVRLLIVVSLSVLFLPSFGPLMDHHLTERQHNHTHVYLGGVVPEHTHPYLVPHTHGHALEVADAASGGLPLYLPHQEDIVFLSAHDGMGQDSTPATAPALQVAVVFPDSGDGGFLFGPAHDSPVPLEAFVPPPTRPPRL